MTVSVIVPLYNKAPYIQRTLASILDQTYTDFEVLVVDDGSTDDGAALVSRCPDPRVRLLQQPNAGPGAARNRGLDEARGQYVAFLDADDEWLPRFLERSLELLAGFGPEVASITSGYFLHPAGVSTEAMWRNRGLRAGTYRVDPELSPQFTVYLLAYLSCWSTVARTETVQRWGGFYTRDRCVYGEDSFLWLKMLLHETVAVNLEPLVRFHTEASALSSNLRGPRPIEPILLHPEELERDCPPELAPLLRQVLALRAIRTASMLGYWGRRREANNLLQRFRDRPTHSWSQYLLARLAASLPGTWAGRTWRLCQRTVHVFS